MKKIVLSLLIMILALSLVACQSAPAATEEKESTSTSDKVFKISAIPDFDQAELTRGFDDFAKYLSDATGLTVEYVPVMDYAAVVTSFERGDIDMAWFGGLTGVQARAAVPSAQAIAQRPSDEKFQSVFIRQTGLDISGLNDLVGHSFAFGSESSTSGHLMPRYFLQEAGIDPENDFDGTPVYSGSHDKTYGLVEAGSVEAGAVNKQYWDKALAENAVDTTKVEAFYTTPEYYDYNWTINDVDAKFGEGTLEKMKQALLAVTPEDSAVMELLSAEKFIATNNDNYKSIENVARQLGIIK